MSRLLLGVSLWTRQSRAAAHVVRRIQPTRAIVTPDSQDRYWSYCTTNYTAQHAAALSCRTFATAKKIVKPPVPSSSRHNSHAGDAKKSTINKKTASAASSSSSSHHDRNEDDAKSSTCSDNNKKKQKTALSVGARAGRIVTIQQKGVKSEAKQPRLCVGCGTEVVASSSGVAAGSGASSEQQVQGMVAGQETTSGKRGRYVDAYRDPSLQFTTGSGKPVSGFLCERCRALQGNNIWKAYDSLRDVSPKVFADQLQHIVRRRTFSLCLMVVDATDAEHTAIKNLRRIIGSTPVILAINKIDLLPRFNSHDCRLLANKVREITGLDMIQNSSYGVSAVTDAGIVDLARDLLSKLGGRDVFVVGCANVGKSSLVKKLSSLIARSVYYRGGNRKQQEKRRLAAQNLNVTGSCLPGTTLQAVRVPCFSSSGNALWDTPGIINPRAVQYHLFPSHLMEPMLHPRTIQVPTVENGLTRRIQAGFSILIEATWMDSGDAEDDDDHDGLKHIKSRDSVGVGNAYGVLGRIDVKTIDIGSRIVAEAFIHPALRIRIVPTELAPSRATVPPHHVKAVKNRIRNATGRQDTGLADAYSLPLSAYISKERADGAFKADLAEQCPDGYYRMDIVFASLGFVKFSHKAPYEVIPHCVEGSIFSKRSNGLYPSNLANFLRDQRTPEFQPIPITDKVLKELGDAAKDGRHFSNRDRDDSVDDSYFIDNDWVDPDFYRNL